MEYEFKAGDFVEKTNGDIGWIRAVNYDTQTGCCYMYCNMLSKTNFEVSCYDTELPNYFRRIGTYDFTESKQPEKIEKLSYEKTVEARDRDNVVVKRLYLKLNQEDIIDKLNEVIDRVNEIGGKE